PVRSSSTQPPDTEPAIWPSSRIATMAPTGRGAEPQVLTIVPSATRRPCLRQLSALRSTSISTLSMRKSYLNSAALSERAITDFHACAVRERDLAHDGKAEAAAGAAGAGNAIKALDHAAALERGNPRAIVLDFHERRAIAQAGAHRDVAARWHVFERVVREVRDRFAQQQRVAVDRRRVEPEAQVDFARQRLMHPLIGFAFDQRLEIHWRSAGAAARFGAREREQLVGEARGADRRLVHLLELQATRLGQGLGQGDFGVRLQSRERRAQLVRGVCQEALPVAIA